MKVSFAEEVRSLKRLTNVQYGFYALLAILIALSAYFLDGARGFVFGGGPAILLFQTGVSMGIGWRTPRLLVLSSFLAAGVFLFGSALGIAILPLR